MTGYAEAAVKLQRDWDVNAQDLPFAKNVKGQALVSLVQKGLRYHHLSLTIDEVLTFTKCQDIWTNSVQNGRPSKQLTPSMFFFGPESERAEPETREVVLRPASSDPASTPDPTTNLIVPRKREVGPNGMNDSQPQPAPKRSRKTNLDRNGGRKSSAPPGSTPGGPTEAEIPDGHLPPAQDAQSPSAIEGPIEQPSPVLNGVRSDDRMDVDTDGEQQVEAPVEVMPLIAHTLTNGESKGIQVAPAKVANLGPSTSIVELPNNKQLMQAVWRPQDQHLIAVRGDSLCGVWKQQSVDGAKISTFQELVHFGEADESLVTAVAWEPNGSILAVATCSNNGGQLHLYDGQDLTLLETLPASQRAIIRLQWQKTGLRLVGLAPYDEQNIASTILLWDLSGAAAGPGPLSVTVPETLEDLDCAFCDGNGMACAAGGQAVYHCRAFSELEVEQKWTSQSPDGLDRWAFVKCSWRNQAEALLVAASSETGRIWLPARDLLKQDAHQSAITGLQVRPYPAAGVKALSTSEFATSSVDGMIKVWKYESPSNSLSCISKLTLGSMQLLKTLAFSPDGFCLAGASYSNVRIWNAEHAYNQMASWQGSEDEWKGSNIKDEDLVSDGAMSSVTGDAASMVSENSLGWDTDSKQLAFALGSQVCCTKCTP